MQVARNFYLSTEKTFTRKIYEVLLACKIEQPAHQGPDPRDLHEPDLPGPARLRLRRGQRDLFRQAAEGHHRRRGGDAGRPAEGAVGLQPDRQSEARDARASSYIIERMHENGFITAEQADAAQEAGAAATRDAADVARARRVRGRDGAPADLRAVRRRGLHARPERLHHDRSRPSRTPPTGRCARASWTTSGARSTAAPRTTSTCRPTRRSSTTRIDDALAEHPDNDDAAWRPWCSRPTPKKVVAVLQNGETITITGDGLKPAQLGPVATRRQPEDRRSAAAR